MNPYLHSSKITKLFFAAFFFSVMLAIDLPVFAQVNDSIVKYITPRLELFYYPPLRASHNAPQNPEYDVARLNLLSNTIENYLQYQTRLEKIPRGIRARLLYAPELSTDIWNDDRSVMRIRRPGINETLSLINTWITAQPDSKHDLLFDSSIALHNIPDQYPRVFSEVTLKYCLANYSSFALSLEPDISFTVLDSSRVVTCRPNFDNNQLFLLSDDKEVCTGTAILTTISGWFSDLTSSPNGKKLAFTRDHSPCILFLDQEEAQKPLLNLFPSRKILMLNMSWSPSSKYLAGFILDETTKERELFIYDTIESKFVEGFLSKEVLNTNSLYATIYWAPNSERLFLAQAKGLHLLDLSSSILYTDAVRLGNSFAELIWSDDSNSFALVEIVGQSRSQAVFDDLDFRSSILRRYHIHPDFRIQEDLAQRTESRHTIKPICFWGLGRVLYLEGRLKSKRDNSSLWDLSGEFSAKLTPTPVVKTLLNQQSSNVETSAITLPLSYLFVYTTLGGESNKIVNAGLSSSNHLYCKQNNNIWFLGLKKTDTIKTMSHSFSIRHLPYPFIKENTSFISSLPKNHLFGLLKFLDGYNLRDVSFSSDASTIFFLANFEGPLNLWSAKVEDIINAITK